jgi:hypothetical protein
LHHVLSLTSVVEIVDPVQNGERPFAIRACGRTAELDFSVVHGDGGRAEFFDQLVEADATPGRQLLKAPAGVVR